MHASRSRLHSRSHGLRFDVGTLWTLERDAHVARCALIWLPHAWELRVVIDDDALLSEWCRTQHSVFAVAGAWQAKLREIGWGEPSELISSVGSSLIASAQEAREHTDARVRLKTRH